MPVLLRSHRLLVARFSACSQPSYFCPSGYRCGEESFVPSDGLSMGRVYLAGLEEEEGEK